MISLKNEKNVTIHGWMINNLKLKGNELLIYAIIYSFTQDGEQWFKGNRSDLATWCNSTTKGIQKNLNRLVEKNLLLKKEIYVNNVKFCEYQTNFNFNNKAPQIGGGKQSPFCNIEDFIYINNINRKTEKYIKKKNDHSHT